MQIPLVPQGSQGVLEYNFLEILESNNVLVIDQWKFQVFDDFFHLLDGDMLVHTGQTGGKIRYG